MMLRKRDEMEELLCVKRIAKIYTDFPEKFGIPRQSGLSDAKGKIVFEPEYRNPEAVRGLEAFSHLWLIWGFSEIKDPKWRPTVRPPRLGGNTRMGVFATRSPFRPNPIGLSCVKLMRIERTASEGVILHVSGVDMVDETPIYDIKPYLPYVDCKEDAEGGFAKEHQEDRLSVEIPKQWEAVIPEAERHTVVQILSQDPRPSYQNDPNRIYGLTYGTMEIKFRVQEDRLTVCEIKVD